MNHWGAIAAVIVGVVITIVGIVLGWSVFPNIVEDEIAENVILYNDTDQFERFEKLPIDLDFKVYLFHVTNPAQVNSGNELPKVEERGPYVYKQSRQKKDITWESKKELSYYEYLKFEFDEKASGEWREDDNITVLNPALNGAIQILEITGLTFLLPLLSDTADLSFGDKDIFLKTNVRDYLFDGYKICQIDKIKKLNIDEKKKIDAVVACLGLYVMPTKNIRPNIDEKNNETELIFTFLAHKANHHDGRYTINTGVGDVHQVAWIKRWEDNEYLPSWVGNESKCNEVRGRDAVIYEPHLTEKSVLTVFNTDICRTVDLRYTNDQEFRDVTALEFQLGEDAFKASATERPDTMCYCLNITRGITQENGCSKDGMMELFTCYNAPILVSYPHLMWADKEYKDAVEGLHPVISKHKTFALLEPNTGTPLGGSKRVQFNMFVRAMYKNGVSLVDFLEGYKNRDVLVPLLWLEEGFEITDDLYDVLYDQYVSKTYIIEGVTWGVIAVGLTVIVGTLIVFTIMKIRASKQTV